MHLIRKWKQRRAQRRSDRMHRIAAQDAIYLFFEAVNARTCTCPEHVALRELQAAARRRARGNDDMVMALQMGVFAMRTPARNSSDEFVRMGTPVFNFGTKPAGERIEKSIAQRVDDGEAVVLGVDPAGDGTVVVAEKREYCPEFQAEFPKPVQPIKVKSAMTGETRDLYPDMTPSMADIEESGKQREQQRVAAERAFESERMSRAFWDNEHRKIEAIGNATRENVATVIREELDAMPLAIGYSDMTTDPDQVLGVRVMDAAPLGWVLVCDYIAEDGALKRKGLGPHGTMLGTWEEGLIVPDTCLHQTAAPETREQLIDVMLSWQHDTLLRDALKRDVDSMTADEIESSNKAAEDLFLTDSADTREWPQPVSDGDLDAHVAPLDARADLLDNVIPSGASEDDGPVPPPAEVDAIMNASMSERGDDLLSETIVYETDRRGGKAYALPARVTCTRRTHPDMLAFRAAEEQCEGREDYTAAMAECGFINSKEGWMLEGNPVPIPNEGTVHLIAFSPARDMPYREFSVPHSPHGTPRSWRHGGDTVPF